MALAKYGGIISELRGKEAGVVFSRNKYGSYMKQKISPVNPNSEFQSAVRASMGSIASSWKTLGDESKDSWNEFGAEMVRTNRFGDQTNYSGFNVFMKVNRNLATAGVAAITAPSAPPEFPTVTIGAFAPDTGAISIPFTPTPVTTGMKLIIEATPPIVGGKRFVKNKFRFVKVIAAAATSPQDIATEYAVRFGSLPKEDDYIAVRIWLVDTTSGWNSVAAEKGAVVVSA